MPAIESAPVAALASDTVELFADGVISTNLAQWRITFTADGDTAYFAQSAGFFPATRQAWIYRSARRGVTWSEPELAEFSGVHSDIDPFITADGGRLYFSSIRPVDGEQRGDIDIWYVERTAAGRWGTPVRLGEEVNSAADELYPSASAEGDLYFASGPRAPTPDADWNIQLARRRGTGFAPRGPVAAVNTRLAWNAQNPTADWEFNPEISPDGRTLIFASLRPGGYGFGDLYVSHRRAGGWSAPHNLGRAVNSEWDEFHPTLGPDGWLYFARNRFDARQGDFYRIPVRAVPALAHPDGD